MTDPFDTLSGRDGPEQPDPAFADRLRRRVEAIERRAETSNEHQEETMTNPTPAGTHPAEATLAKPLIPYLSVTDSRAAMAFYAEVFGAEPYGEVIDMGDGRVGHAMVTIGDQLLYMADEFPEMNVLAPTSRGGGTVSMVIQVADCDETFAHAVDAGATPERVPVNQHGARSGWFVDPWGHRWSPTSPAKPGVD